MEKYFGHREFLDGQEEVVNAILSGRDTMAIMPTGGGKSLCYQLPALCMEGVTVVVSPLIALMKDQVDALERRGIPAAMLNSTQGMEAQRERINALQAGRIKLLYVAPERFRQRSFQAALKSVPLALFAVDEAHCLSQWGHDFRPDYLRLESVVEELDYPLTAAFTATATPAVRKDILETLKLRDPMVAIRGFERPNLALAITPCEKREIKLDRLRAVIDEQRTGIVYCSTRKNVEEMAAVVAGWGKRVIAYHGGLSDQERERAQNRFIEKSADVAVATNAFGMGIDRSDVRFVIHYDVPGSVEAYYQEAGRAGRDGEPSVCELLFNYADTRTQEFFIEGNNPEPTEIRMIYEVIREQALDRENEVEVTIKEIAEMAGLKNDRGVSTALSFLARLGYLERFDIPGQRRRGTRLLRPEVRGRGLELDEQALAEKSRRDREKLKSMINLCYSDDCRQAWILDYFGEEKATQCGSCDNCMRGGRADLRGPDEEEKLIVQKALSGVARMSRKVGEEYHGRFGLTKIVAMLIGSRSQDVLQFQLDRLSTHGLLKSLGQGYVFQLMKELIRRGMLTQATGDRPLVTLTERGAKVMKGAVDYKISWPEKPIARKKYGIKTGEVEAGDLPVELTFDAELFEKLRTIRAELAEAESLPAYVIFNNQTLEFLARIKPKSREAAEKIHGIGKVKAEKYLAPFLKTICEHSPQ